jgi:hypothetical protein
MDTAMGGTLVRQLEGPCSLEIDCLELPDRRIDHDRNIIPESFLESNLAVKCLIQASMTMFIMFSSSGGGSSPA